MYKSTFKYLVILITVSFQLSIDHVNAQLVKITPENPTLDEPVTIEYDATKGTLDLVNSESVYMHSGVIKVFGGTNWKNVVGNWGEDNGLGKMTKKEGTNNIWQIKLESIRSYYNLIESDRVFRLGIVFRNANGSKTGKAVAADGSEADIFLDIDIREVVEIVSPTNNIVFLNDQGEIEFKYNLSDKGLVLMRWLDHLGNQEDLNTADVISGSFTIKPVAPEGAIAYVMVAVINNQQTEPVQGQITYFTPPERKAKLLPEGMKDGINILDDQSVLIALTAPKLENIVVLGDFTNWEFSLENQLTNYDWKNKIYWKVFEGLDPNIEYAYQYLINGEFLIADPYSTKILDRENDPLIPDSIYPDKKTLNTFANFNYASTFKINEEKYKWSDQEQNWKRPDKNELIIYEILTRDFSEEHSFEGIIKNIDYIKSLGVNAIQLMPIAEFQGNSSWGYEVNYHMALDKAYGTKNKLKALVDLCHQNNIAVIIETNFNQVSNNSPLANMWVNGTRPAHINPYVNRNDPHPQLFGLDLDHSNIYTQKLIDRTTAYWMNEFHLDGFKFNGTKGYTQTKSTTEEDFNKFDQSRVDNILRMTNEIKKIDPLLYIIVDHTSNEEERKILLENDLILYRNRSDDYQNLLIGNQRSLSLDATSDYITYYSNHDTERFYYFGTSYGKKNNEYDIADPVNTLNRIMAANTFFFLSDGPKHFFMYNEIGYPDSINLNGRTGKKHIPNNIDGINWFELVQPNQLLTTTALAINLKRKYKNAFQNGAKENIVSGWVKSMKLDHEDLKMVTLANFGLEERNTIITFPSTGTYYNLVTGKSIEINSPLQTMQLKPGEFAIYVDKEFPIFTEGGIKAFDNVLQVNPSPPKEDDLITLVFDTDKLRSANKEDLIGYFNGDDLFLEIGAITEIGTEPSITLGRDINARELFKLKKIGEHKYQIDINPSILFKDHKLARIHQLKFVVRNSDNTFTGIDSTEKPFEIDLLPASDQPIVSITPENFSIFDEITITYDTGASKTALSQLINSPKIYMHSGTISTTDTKASWENVIGNWGIDDGVGKMKKSKTDQYQWTITLTPNDYFNLDGEHQEYLAMLFRNNDGTLTSKSSSNEDILLQFTKKDITGISDPFKKESSPKTYPNPSSGQFNISLPNQIERNFVINIYSTEGKLIQSHKIENNNKNTIPIQIMSQKKQSVYQIHLIDKNQTWYTRSLVH